jgi:putative PEP-CTERM system histidine kinase
MESTLPWLAVASYSVAALAYGVVAALVIAGRPRTGRAKVLLVAIIASSLWAGGLVVSLTGTPLPRWALMSLEVAHLFIWTMCVLTWIVPRSTGKWLLAASAAAGLLAVVAALPESPVVFRSAGYPALVLMTLLCFLGVEQVYRNAPAEARRHLKLLCLGIGAIAAVDLFVYSHATLLGAPQASFWAARGFANAAFVPLIAFGVRRQSGWERELAVSRHVVFYTASLLGVGAYLFAMGLVAYVIRAFGSEWSLPLDLLFLSAGAGVLLATLFSASIRARFKAFLIKHFYRTKYDYREAWLRLTQSLSKTGDLRQSAASGLEGLARIIGSVDADLWLERDDHRYDWLVSLGGDVPAAPRHFEREHPLVKFLSSTGWVIDSEEYADEPDRYGTAFGSPDDALLPPNSLVVPLDRQGYLQGFVVLRKPAGLRSLNFEDHDILKTAGRQVAAVLAQALVQEKLAETRQFEALNRLTAFLMHDLKNIVAQQELVVANAQRFKHREDFIDDAFKTIRGGTERIKKVLAELASASRTKPTVGRVDLSKIIMEVRSQCADRQPIPEIDAHAQAAWVRMDRDELASALLHLVRNAQDATPPDGRISVELSRSPNELVVTVADTGCGMDEAFVRDRLFRPFDSTKGQVGMGIGAYQARHIVRRAGGELEVKSARGRGTTFVVRLPAAT